MLLADNFEVREAERTESWPNENEIHKKRQIGRRQSQQNSLLLLDEKATRELEKSPIAFSERAHSL